MSTPLYIHRYRLALRESSTVVRASSPKHLLKETSGRMPEPQLAGNALSARSMLEGFLIRCGDGFGCVHPWPELGDPTMAELLAALRDGKRHRLLDRAMDCAADDGAARRARRSLFAGLTIPRSHATIIGDADIPALAAAGFSTVKLKTHGSDPALPGRVEAAAAAGLKVRIDCNGTGTAMLAELRPWAESVDFIEDPETYDAGKWREIREQFGFRLALDRLDRADCGGYDVRVLKPALETCEARNVPVVFTSYMDHPLGQMWAALEAARYEGQQLEAGLLTHVLFEPDAFTEAVKAVGPQLLPPEGTGLGFDALLDALPWERLTGPAPAATVSPEAWKAAGFWQSTVPLLLTNPRAPLADPPRELPDGCLVFATSGSTGIPSLVCLSRGAILANAASVNDWLSATADDVWLRTLPAFHVGGLSIHARGFLTGSRVVVDEEKWNPARFAELLQGHGITLTSLVPSQVFDLVTARLAAPSSLRAVIVGGGALEASLFDKARALGWTLLPSYGMTEASSQVATARPGLHDSLPPLELLPCWEARVNEEGRLHLRGAPLLSGRMVRGPEGWDFQPALDADDWFTTTDRAALEGRILTLLGRCDRTVKILGELVDLDAIETALAAAGLPPDRGAVIAIPDPRAGVRPWLVTDFAGAEEIVSAANAALPPFARMAGCRRQELPRSPLGKVLRGTLGEAG